MRASPRGITFVDATLVLPDGRRLRGTLRVQGSRIVALGAQPQAGDRIVDLAGDLLLPGLVNAHEHLQLNGFPRFDGARRYRNVREWIADVQAQRRADAAFRAAGSVAREARYLHGALKNLLAGVTTVAHHDPLHAPLGAADFPVRVVERCGWAHSLGIDGEAGVHASFRRTPPKWPWIVHAAEGVDDEAAAEFDRLHSLGCIAANSVLVHAVALGPRQRDRLLAAGAGAVWCPASNLRLFGATADCAALAAAGRLAIGSDSRLSGSRDLLDELRVARAHGTLAPVILESLATRDGARLLRLDDRGVLQAGALADLVVLPREAPPGIARRADVRLVMIGGAFRWGDVPLASALETAAAWRPAVLDGRARAIDGALAAAMLRARVSEPGLEVPERAGRAA